MARLWAGVVIALLAPLAGGLAGLLVQAPIPVEARVVFWERGLVWVSVRVGPFAREFFPSPPGHLVTLDLGGARVCFPARPGVYRFSLYIPSWTALIGAAAAYAPTSLLLARIWPGRRGMGLVLLAAAGVVLAFIAALLLEPTAWASPACGQG